MFALPTLAVLILHATPLQVGALSALQTLPLPVLGLFVGVLADRLSRRRIMMVADLLSFAALLSVPLAAYAGILGIPQLYGVALITGVGAALFGISYQSYLPVIVPPENLTDANTKLEFSNSGAAMAGTVVAGALVQWIGAAAAIAADAFSYLVSVASLLAIRSREPLHDGPPLSVGQTFVEMRSGLHLVLRSHDLRCILGATAVTNFGGGMIGAVFFIYAYRILHLKAGLFGLVDGLAEIGFVGALLSTRIRRRVGLRATLIGALLIASFGALSTLAAMRGAPYVVLFISSALVAVAIPIYNVNQVSYRQALVDVRMQGRLNATMRTFVWGTVPLGALSGGYLGTLIGSPITIAIGAIISGLAAVFLLPFQERAREGSS